MNKKTLTWSEYFFILSIIIVLTLNISMLIVMIMKYEKFNSIPGIILSILSTIYFWSFIIKNAIRK